MMKLIKYAFELIVPIALIFVVIPRLLSLVKNVLGFGGHKKKKKYKKPDYIRGKMLGTLPPPPPSRNELSRRERMAKELDQYEVRNGRIVKKRLPSNVKVGEKISLDYESELSIEEEFGIVEKVKKKHFNKGVDPDFL